MSGLPPSKHDRDLHLRPLVQEADDMALLRLVVVNADLGSELDLLDADRNLMFPRELELLLLLVAVLPVVHDPRYGRIRLRGHLDEVEVLRVCVLPRLVGRLDPDLRAVFVDESYLGGADVLVDPGVRDGWP